MTQRILLLLESAALGRGDAYESVRRNILGRYILEDYGWAHETGPYRVPRFLLNDFARYWRTVAVDFAYKRRQRQGNGWALRTIKLRVSRKLTFASGLIACYSCAIPALASNGLKGASAQADDHPVIVHLSDLFRRSPLEIMAVAYLQYPQLQDAARLLFDSYDEFLRLLNDEDRRSHLEDLPPSEAAGDPVFEDARELGHAFQDALNKTFLDDNGTDLHTMTRVYGVF